MLAVWRAVQEEIHVRGAKSVRQACEKLFYERADELIKFVDVRGDVLDIIAGEKVGANTLRQRYQTAEKCRHDAERFPYLYSRSRQLLEILPGTFERLKAGNAEFDQRRKTGNWLS